MKHPVLTTTMAILLFISPYVSYAYDRPLGREIKVGQKYRFSIVLNPLYADKMLQTIYPRQSHHDYHWAEISHWAWIWASKRLPDNSWEPLRGVWPKVITIDVWASSPELNGWDRDSANRVEPVDTGWLGPGMIRVRTFRRTYVDNPYTPVRETSSFLVAVWVRFPGTTAMTNDSLIVFPFGGSDGTRILEMRVFTSPKGFWPEQMWDCYKCLATHGLYSDECSGCAPDPNSTENTVSSDMEYLYNFIESRQQLIDDSNNITTDDIESSGQASTGPMYIEASTPHPPEPFLLTQEILPHRSPVAVDWEVQRLLDPTLLDPNTMDPNCYEQDYSGCNFYAWETMAADEKPSRVLALRESNPEVSTLVEVDIDSHLERRADAVYIVESQCSQPSHLVLLSKDPNGKVYDMLYLPSIHLGSNRYRSCRFVVADVDPYWPKPKLMPTNDGDWVAVIGGLPSYDDGTPGGSIGIVSVNSSIAIREFARQWGNPEIWMRAFADLASQQ